jgi:hypothetical protein
LPDTSANRQELNVDTRVAPFEKRTMNMKWYREFLFLAGFLISACSSPPDLETAQAQLKYAKMGEGMTPTINKVEQSNPQRGTTPHLSTTSPPVKN